MIRNIVLALLMVVGVAILVQPTVSYAFDPVNDNKVCTGSAAEHSAACINKSTQDPIAGDNGILIKITTIIATLAGAAAVIIIVLAGFYFITANGDAGKIASARNAVIYALLGIIIILIARSLVVFVVRRL